MRHVSVSFSSLYPVPLSPLDGNAVIDEKLKTFRSLSQDRWEQTMLISQRMSLVYKSTPRSCLVSRWVLRALLSCIFDSAAFGKRDTRGHLVEWKFRIAELGRGSLCSRSENEKQRSFILFTGRFSRWKRHFYGAAEHFGNYVPHRGVYFRSVSCTLKLRLRAVFHPFRWNARMKFSSSGNKLYVF